MSKNRPRVTFPEDDFTYDFRKLRGKKTVNPELRKAIAKGPEKNDGMKFCTDGVDIGTIDARMAGHIKAAKERKYMCPHCGEEHTADYHIVLHRKTVPHVVARSDSEDDMMEARTRNELMEKKFGAKIVSCFHVAAHCKNCEKRIKFVKYNEANRRAAGDFLLMNEDQRGYAADYMFK